MNVIKKNMVSIIFGVIAIMAVIAIFWPIQGMYDGLQTDVDGSKAIGTKLNTVHNASRLMPLLSPYVDTPAPLNVFPTAEVIKAGVLANKQLHDQSDKMLETARKYNLHLLILADSLPHPESDTIFKWTDAYLKQITNDARWRQKLNACVRPTAAEVDKAKQAAHDKILQNVVTSDDATKKEADVQYAEEALKIRPQMAVDRARGGSIYLEPDALARAFDKTIGSGAANLRLPDAGDIWDAQLAIWAYDDITDAIARTNSKYADPAAPGGPPAADVLHTPIKQLISIDHPTFVPPANPADLTAGQTTAVPTSLVASATGHVSNGMYDVYKYNVVVDVDAAKVAEILRELEVNQFITVLNVQLTAVDLASAGANDFMYGDKPVVKLVIQCEELFLHSWTDKWIPESRKGGAGSHGSPNFVAPGEGGGGMMEGDPMIGRRRPRGHAED